MSAFGSTSPMADGEAPVDYVARLVVDPILLASSWADLDECLAHGISQALCFARRGELDAMHRIIWSIYGAWSARCDEIGQDVYDSGHSAHEEIMAVIDDRDDPWSTGFVGDGDSCSCEVCSDLDLGVF